MTFTITANVKRCLQTTVLLGAIVSAFWAGYRTHAYQHPDDWVTIKDPFAAIADKPCSTPPPGVQGQCGENVIDRSETP
jgi:hypothetical protein